MVVALAIAWIASTGSGMFTAAGMGIGCAVVQRIIQRHGGRL